jgi:ribonuclease P protein component
MTPSLARLPGNEFRARGYRAASTPFFLLKTKKNSTGKRRVGMVIGKAVDKGAVKRNFWKRQAKEVFKKTADVGTDILIIFSPRVTTLTKKDFQAELSRAVSKLKNN